MGIDLQPPRATLEPLPYLKQMADYLRTQEAQLWDWFSSHRVRAEKTDAVRVDLLKSTYRLESDSQPRVYELAADVARRMGMDVAVTFYQTQNASGLNVGIAFIPGEAHITIDGPVLDRLSDDEMRCAIGHELAHLALWDGWEGQYTVAEQILSAMVTDPDAAAVHQASARYFSLFTEVFCDRSALSASDDSDAAICMLVKIQTGLKQVSADSFLRQAQEIFDTDSPRTEGLTHPESYIRTRAIDLWRRGVADCEQKIDRMIRGPLGLADVDLLNQQVIADMTGKLMDVYLAPAWLQSESVRVHARLFFDTYEPPPGNAPDLAGLENITDCDPPLLDYYCYVLLDLASADRDLEDAPVAAALQLTEKLGFGQRFREILLKERSLRKKQLETLQKTADTIVAEAVKQHEKDQTG